jgi:hypothetical protein
MKKTALTIAFLIFLFLAPSAHAQEFDFAKAYQDYIFTQTVYDQSYSTYEEAKNSYLKNPTLTLKEDARIKTLVMLRARDELYRVYLSALRMKLFEAKSPVSTRLDDEIAWYLTHKDTYKDSDPLEDLFNKSKESESRYKSDTSPIAHDSLFSVSFGELMNIKTQHEGVYKSLKNSIDLGVGAGILKLDPFNRWFTDIENVLKELDTINTNSKAKIAKIFDKSGVTTTGVYNSAISSLTPAISKSLELNSFLTELLNTINSELSNK